MFPPPTLDARHRRPFPWLVGVLLVTLLVFAPAVANDFTYDDRHLAMGHDGERRNEMVATLQPPSEYFTSHYWRGTAEHSRLYRPVTILSFALRHAVAGDSARLAHLLNILLHLGATALVFGLLRGLLCNRRTAALGSLFFGLHAIHSEVVAAVSGRAELLAFCGGAGALLLLLRGRAASHGARRLCMLAASVSMFVALGGKESAVAWIPFAACYGLARRWAGPERRPWRPRLLVAEAVAMVAPLLALAALRAIAMSDLPEGVVWSADPAVNPVFHAPVLTRVLTATMVWGYGLALTCLPFSLSADYGSAVFPIVEGFAEPTVLLALVSAAVLGGIGVGGVARAERHPLLFTAAASFLGFSALTSNVAFPIGTIFGERLYYAPSLAVAMAVAWIAPRVRAPLVPVALVAAGMWLGASAQTALERHAAWRDNEALIFHELQAQPRSVRMRVQAARVLHERGQPHAAIAQLERAVELDPEHAPAWEHLRVLYAEVGESQKAEACARHARPAPR